MRIARTVCAALMLVLVVGAVEAWAEQKVTITREVSKPAQVEVKSGEEVRFVNASGGSAHVWFGGNEGVKFYVGKGDSKVKFDVPGTYEYTVHISGTKVHSHRGTVVVK